MSLTSAGIAAIVLGFFVGGDGLSTVQYSTDPQTGRQCRPHESMRRTLENSYGEIVRARGLSVTRQYMHETFVAPDGSWTILVTSTAGCSFVLSSGIDMMFIDGDPKGEVH